MGDHFGDISVIKENPEPFTYIADDDTKLMFIPKKSYSSTLKEIEPTLL